MNWKCVLVNFYMLRKEDFIFHPIENGLVGRAESIHPQQMNTLSSGNDKFQLQLIEKGEIE